MKKTLATILLLLVLPTAHAQIAGLSAYSVLDMPTSARIAGLGFNFLSLYDDDVALTIDNPSLIAPHTSRQLTAGLTTLFAGATFGTAAYCHHFDNLGTFTFGLRYDSFGQFDGYDDREQSTGTFTAADYVLSIGWGRAIAPNFSIGANFKPILSHYEGYSAFAFGIDLAATYISDDQSLSLTFLGRNIGAQIATFDGTTEQLHYELAMAGSYKLKDAPFRIHFAFNELQTWDLTYGDPHNPTATTDPFSGETVSQSALSTLVDKVLRHVGVGVELNVRQAFYATIGYSYRQRTEMRAAEIFNMSGFSFGLGLNLKGFKICYARNNYHLSQAPNYISITTSLDRFFR